MASVVDLNSTLHNVYHSQRPLDNAAPLHHSSVHYPNDVLPQRREAHHVHLDHDSSFSASSSDQRSLSNSVMSSCSTPSSLQDPFVPDETELEEEDPLPGYSKIKMDPSTWASNLPADQGLYSNENERDSCGVGFICKITGEASHLIVSDARSLLCAMTHRGAVGADTRDGDGAGVMTGIPHELFKREVERDIDCQLPDVGKYAVGNVFMNPNDVTERKKQQQIFEHIASDLGLRVLGWREVPTDRTILGPAALSKEPIIFQPFVVLKAHYGQGNKPENGPFDEIRFEKQLYVLRKHATHTITLAKWFYVCSLSSKNIVYKGQLSPRQVYDYYHDLNHVLYKSHFALVHSRFSTNTFPSWDRAQPMRWAAHNGEINTVRGNKNWMRAREGNLRSELFGDDLDLLYPIIEGGGSDSAAFDNVLELLVVNGVVTLPEAVMMLIPEAWQDNDLMDAEKKAFYQWAACLQEPWDGPALFAFSDGRYCGANLDRNGLRPCRYVVTSDNIIICASEVGVLYIEPEKVIQKGRLKPGRMLLVDTVEKRIVDDKELKRTTSLKQNFASWVEGQNITVPKIIKRVQRTTSIDPVIDEHSLSTDPVLLAFGYTVEQLSLLLLPMINEGKEALGSMGNDAPLAAVATQPRIIHDYFRQLFAQVTNPPIDPIREDIVMSLESYVGPEGNILEQKAEQCHRIVLPSPVLTIHEMNAMKHLKAAYKRWESRTIDITFPKGEGLPGYQRALDRVFAEANEAVDDGVKVIILSDRATGPKRVPLSAVAACGGVHHHLVSLKKRAKVALMIETGEAREVHHICVLVGYGADAICPYLIMEVVYKVAREGLSKDQTAQQLIKNYCEATNAGILKVMSKMGISTLQSYKGAQIFEILGLHREVVDKCFIGTASRVQGANFELLAMDVFEFHERAWPSKETILPAGMPESGEYHWRDGGEAHVNDPVGIAHLQDAVREKNQSAYDAYSRNAREQVKRTTLRGLLDFRFEDATPIPIEQVEPWNEVVRRFVTGAMSYGSISMEAHSTLAVAMNRLGGKSNTGEGGEDAERSQILPNGDTMRSAIKQVASGRFGVTSNYLSDADELQIKMAQGAKPGEGGELPGHKVSTSIARTRHSTAGVGLISPPPHHDIYSIEDLKQLIYDLKCANPRSRVSVKLVSEVGVGIVASGVAKAKADHILISGHDGGTGASKWTGIKYAGLPWELGLAETHQTLVLNDLRGRVIVQTDGQIRSGRDVAIACLLGAEEWGFATTPLIAMGCIMMRKCHLNTCPVGIATQDPHLRAKFAGQPEQVINFFYYVAEELRSIMAKLGIRTINEMVGRAELLKVDESLRIPKTAHLDLSAVLKPAWQMRPGAATYKIRQQDHKLYIRLDNKFIDESEPALTKGLPVRIDCNVVNTDRALGTSLSYRVSKLYGEEGLPKDTIHISMQGSAGQSCGAFLAPGITIELEGDSNDYVGKGLSGGRIIVYPPKGSNFKAEENVIVGNVCLYGATSGEAFIRGIAAERFAVRNSGANAVVEGTGDHGCEYMTGGRVVVLGTTGRNFAAGMSGGIAYVLDMAHTFASKVDQRMVELGKVTDPHEIAQLRSLIEDHRHYTGSEIAHRVLDDFHHLLLMFVRVIPHDYKRVLEQEAARAQEDKKRMSTIDLVPSHTASQVDLASETLEDVLGPKASLAATLSSSHLHPPAKKPEVPVEDIEDSAVDEKTTRERLKKLDKTRGFMKYKRLHENYRAPRKRVRDWREISTRLSESELKYQTARCMDCGVPFCQSDAGCPISNVIPKWNDLVFKGQWRDALNRLLLTNNFPEFTGRVCPAPCEGACVLGINEQPVGIKSIECAIIDKGFEEGWMTPQIPDFRTGKRVAIIGSGPAGLACADQLNKAGHTVTVYDRNDRMGGLLMYGIPNMKLDKAVVQRRLELMESEGVTFIPNAHVGADISAQDVRAQNDALVIATGATWPRDLRIPGRGAHGIHFAMEYLQLNTTSLLDSNLEDSNYINARGKDVIVIGGGDTGNDCIGTAMRHGANSVVNFELLPQPPAFRGRDNPWPQWPRIFRTDYGHTEVMAHFGQDPREFCISTKEFIVDEEGKLKGLTTIRVEWTKDSAGRWKMEEIPGSEKFFAAQLVFLALGFLGPEQELLKSLDVKTDGRSNIQTPAKKYSTNQPGVFAAGDCRRGQSLIVWGINEGRGAAAEVDAYFSEGNTRLPAAGGIKTRRFVAPPIVPNGVNILNGAHIENGGIVHEIKVET